MKKTGRTLINDVKAFIEKNHLEESYTDEDYVIDRIESYYDLSNKAARQVFFKARKELTDDSS